MSIKRVRSTIASTVSRLGLTPLNTSGQDVYKAFLISTALPVAVKVNGWVRAFARRRVKKLQVSLDEWRTCAFQLDCDHEHGKRLLNQVKNFKTLDTTLATARKAKAQVRAAEGNLEAARVAHKAATKAYGDAIRAAQA